MAQIQYELFWRILTETPRSCDEVEGCVNGEYTIFDYLPMSYDSYGGRCGRRWKSTLQRECRWKFGWNSSPSTVFSTMRHRICGTCLKVQKKCETPLDIHRNIMHNKQVNTLAH